MKVSKKKIVGTVNCHGSCDEIPNGSVAKVTLTDSDSVTFGEQEMINLRRFPFHFEIEFEQPASKFKAEYKITAEIRKENNLIYMTDSNINVVDQNLDKLLQKIDINVVRVNLKKVRSASFFNNKSNFLNTKM